MIFTISGTLAGFKVSLIWKDRVVSGDPLAVSFIHVEARKYQVLGRVPFNSQELGDFSQELDQEDVGRPTFEFEDPLAFLFLAKTIFDRPWKVTTSGDLPELESKSGVIY